MVERIIVAEDEVELAELLRDYLMAAGFEVALIHRGDEVLSAFQSSGADLILLDLMLPGLNGIEVFRQVRSLANVPVIMATAKVEEIDRLLGIELGADDYICKPYSLREVVARVKMVLRRACAAQPHEYEGMVLNKAAYQLLINGKDVELTAVEFELFKLLYDTPGCIFSRAKIMDSIYTDHRIVNDRTIDTHVKKIRKKLVAVGADPDIIHSVYGLGYKFELGAGDYKM